MKDNPIVEASLEISETVLDSVTNNEILRSIPVVGTALKLIKGVGDIRDRLFIAKISTFLESLEKVSSELKDNIRQRVNEDPGESKRIGETVLLVVDKLADLDKVDIIAKVFVAYAYGYLKPFEFRRIAHSIDQAFVTDLTLFLNTHNLPKKGPSQEQFMQALYPTGLTKIVGGKTFQTAGELFFEVSVLGNKLINAYSQSKKLCQKQQLKK